MSDQLKVGDQVFVVSEIWGKKTVERRRIVRETATQWIVLHEDARGGKSPMRFSKKDLHQIGRDLIPRHHLRAVPR